MSDKFLNCREWRSFLNTADRTDPYRSVAAALKAGRDWLSSGAVSNPAWLRVNGALVAGAARKTLGV